MNDTRVGTQRRSQGFVLQLWILEIDEKHWNNANAENQESKKERCAAWMRVVCTAIQRQRSIIENGDMHSMDACVL
jgi:hypothetical protein